jgi:prepilin-type N-terminal cleavage/methylation domain-containing protein
MKRAFTLIELLVVIAIIAILAAILFPVFAQAKAAAKKTAAISNQKQIGTAVLLYMGDSDDVYPRNDDCQDKSSLNPKFNSGAYPFNPTGVGCTTGQFYFRMNHYAWQKWMKPYTKNIQIFEHPGRAKLDNAGQWTDGGEMMGGFAINLALTGALNTYNRADTAPGRLRNSWLGGTQSSIPDVARAMFLFEFAHPTVNFAPVTLDAVNNPLSIQTVYPFAVREFWGRWLMRTTGCASANAFNGSEITNTVDDRTVFGNGVIVGHTDSSAKFYSAARFLSETPTAAEFGTTNAAGTGCGSTSGTFLSGATPNLNLDYPFWALQKN